MTRMPLSQRKIRTRQSVMMAALGTSQIMYFVARWFLLCANAMNHIIELRMLRERYFVSYYNRDKIMRTMVLLIRFTCYACFFELVILNLRGFISQVIVYFLL